MSEMVPLSGRKERVNQQVKSTRQNHGSPNANLMDLEPKMMERFRASGSWLCQILHVSNQFDMSQLWMHNDYETPENETATAQP